MISIRRAARVTAPIQSISFNLRKRIATSALTRLVERPVQSYVSTSLDPFLNLSIENHLLQNSPPDSAVLFQYINRPSIVIGRNQNPWLEVNLPLLGDTTSTIGNVDLVRRRSGGGTVFHDQGNVNWTVIVHPSTFTRDKHCEMVVRALHDCGVTSSKVNERHDVVLEHHADQRLRKISGSAYKLTKHRALHHGTCLLSSPNLAQISRYLHAPAKMHITAKGVESVSSPIANAGLSTDEFVQAVQREFNQLYRPDQNDDIYIFNDDCIGIDSIRKDVEHMQSMPWMYLQTPQFTICSPQIVGSTGSPLLQLDVRHGVIADVKLSLVDSLAAERSLRDELINLPLHGISDWSKLIHLQYWKSEHHDQTKDLVEWLQQCFTGFRCAS